jgi:hypothetical protein
MRHRFLGVMLAVAALLAAAPLSAHHSVAGQFDESQSVILKGVISKVDWVNPHIYLYLDVKGDDGQVVTWALGTVPTAMARRAGLTKESITGKPGEVVTIDIAPARDGTKHLGWVSTITYGDGHKYELSRK